jgi:hypothetical protein
VTDKKNQLRSNKKIQLKTKRKRFFKIHLHQQHNQQDDDRSMSSATVELDEKPAETISNDVSLLYAKPYFQYESFANNVDKNNRNRRNFDKINLPQRFCTMSKNDIEDAVRFEDV